MRLGVDVSEHQAGLDVSRFDFVIARTTDGTYQDAAFSSFAPFATAAYHFLRAPSEGTSISEQVSASLEVLGGRRLPMWLDVESPAGLSLLDATVAPLILYELHQILSAAGRHADAASPTPVEQQAAIALAAAAPELAKEGVTWTWMLQGLNGLRGAMGDSPAAAWFDALLEVFRAIQAAEQMYWWLERFGVVPRTPTGTEGRQVVVRELVAKLSAQAIDAAGLRAAYDHPANANLVASAKLAGDFGPRHMSYYKLGYTDIPGGYKVDGCTGYDYAMDWLGQVVEGVAGK